MEWSRYLRPAGEPLMYSYRLSQATSFPRGDLAIEEALSRAPQAVLIGYPYYWRNQRLFYQSAITGLIRRRLYSLALISSTLRLVDMGDVVLDDSEEAPLGALEELVTELLRRGHRVIVFGGGQEAAQALYRAVERQETPFTYTLIDKRLDLIDPLDPAEVPARTYNLDILRSESVIWPTYLHVIGLAWHWVSPAEEHLLHTQLQVPFLRLHEVLEDPNRAEPLLRTARLISMDGGVIRAADAPSVLDPDPEGLPIEVATKLMRFAGKGYYPDVLHLANFRPRREGAQRTASAFALLIWYFIEALINPEYDFPAPDRSNLELFPVRLKSPELHELLFYRHPSSGRWWMNVEPVRGGPPYLFPCDQSHYLYAVEYQEPPRLWYQLQLR
jgi:arginase family enzyme